MGMLFLRDHSHPSCERTDVAFPEDPLKSASNFAFV